MKTRREATPPVRYIDLPDGVTTIDTQFVRPGFNASHLIVEDGRAAFVDVGSSHAVPLLLDVLRQKMIAARDVRFVIITHIHLDHAGGAGALLRHLPNAKVVVHPRGARHLASPERLIKGTKAVYGEEHTNALFGAILPVAKDRIIEAPHEYRISLNGRELLCLDTPGHARHHICIVDEMSRGIFSGDTFGVSFRECDTENGAFIVPTTAPVHFDPPRLHESIEMLVSCQPEKMYLTHFGKVTDVPRLAADLHEMIDAFVRFAEQVRDQKGEERRQNVQQRMEDLYLSRLHEHGCECDRAQMMDILGSDISMNVLGLEVWLDKH